MKFANNQVTFLLKTIVILGGFAASGIFGAGVVVTALSYSF